MSLENIRKFSNVSLKLSGSPTILVGPNNSGKTSLLRVLKWVYDGCDEALLRGARRLTQEETELLYPIVPDNKRARRITLHFHIADGRRRRRYGTGDAAVKLRLQFRRGSVIASFGEPQRGEKSDPVRAIEVLSAWRACTDLTYVPSARFAGDEEFLESLRGQVRARLEGGLRETPGRRARHVSEFIRAQESLAAAGEKLTATMWSEISWMMPESFQIGGRVRVTIDRQDLLDLLVDRARVEVQTPSMGVAYAPVHALGSGMQSLLQASTMTAVGSKPHRFVLFEEPEAFLHPMGQRAIANTIRRTPNVNVLISTHSNVIVDEAEATELVIMRDHHAYTSTRQSDERRDQINTALLTGQGSEAIFAHSVLLVEGPGDKAFLETVRRRLVHEFPLDKLDAIAVVAVGGKTRFGPWVNLLEGYRDGASRRVPIEYCVVADSIDAVSDALRGLRDAGITIPNSVVKAAGKVGSLSGEANALACSELNAHCAEAAIPLLMMPVDLEYAMCHQLGAASLTAACASTEVAASNWRELASKLGSKIDGDPGPEKHDWRRAQLAQVIALEGLHPELKRIIRRWIRPVVDGEPVGGWGCLSGGSH